LRQHEYFNRLGFQERQLVTDNILLKYFLNGQSKEGIIKMYFSYNSHRDKLDYLFMDYSDEQVKNYVEEIPLSCQKFIHIDYLQN